MRRWIFFLVVAAPLVACTHDFGAFETSGADASPASDQGVADTTTDGPTPDSSAGDTSTSDTTPPLDTTPPGDGGPSCTDPGGVLFGGHCYFPLATSSTWDAAKTACASTSAHLVTITSAAEETFVEGIRPGNNRWIGLSRPTTAPPTDPASFVWVTAEPVSFQKWAAGEPNGTGECVRLRNSNDWADQSCTTSYIAVCERE